jgi:hypothetical protein
MLLAHNHAALSLCCACQPWHYRTANRTASDFQRQCCCLASGSLYAARGSLYAAPAVNCQPFFLPAESAEKEPCLLNDPALYTAAAWPRLYCRLTGPVQPITAWRLLASAAAQPMRPLPLCTCKQLERYTIINSFLTCSLGHCTQWP